MRLTLMLFIALGWVVLTLSGCSTDVKNIERLNYATAIGVDYKDGEYRGFVQFVDLQAEAKTTEGINQEARIWIGEGRGETFEDSFFNIYRTAQERIFWGHLTAVVISESAMKKGLPSILDSITRYNEFRLTPVVFGTRGSVKEILSQGGFYGQSPLSTILHEPGGIYQQSSFIHSVQMHRLISYLNEPGYTTCIPTLAVNNLQWTEKNKRKKLLMIDGAIFVKDQSYRSFIPLKELTGMRWIQKDTQRAGVPVPIDGGPSVQAVINRSKPKLKLLQGGYSPEFKFLYEGSGYLVNRANNEWSKTGELNEAVEKVIRKEVEDLFQTGRRKHTDVMNLEYHMFRYHHRLWSSLPSPEATIMSPDTLSTINVHVNIRHTSTVKNRNVLTKPQKE
ncbi:Ger(x)C family spore germination protein [Paenibacillus sp. PL2-23]|uniref:Ger(x)C family spore germination protein n=1 Tax=Paenibacillus sp. PL2-23 TaxID=2100729 RepID=UPI0030F67BC5